MLHLHRLLEVNIFWGCTSTTSVFFQQQNALEEIYELVPASQQPQTQDPQHQI